MKAYLHLKSGGSVLAVQHLSKLDRIPKGAEDMLPINGFVITSVGSLLIVALAPAHRTKAAGAEGDDSPRYTASGELKMRGSYREWIVLSSGVDMNYYSPPGHHTFEKVFVNPNSYLSSVQSGKWPDKTIFMREVRAAAGAVSITKNGLTQAASVIAHEGHVKDARLDGGWAFLDVNDSGTGKPIMGPANCYQCHETHAAVDATFVQLYPTLLQLAKDKGTLSSAYLRDGGYTRGQVMCSDPSTLRAVGACPQEHLRRFGLSVRPLQTRLAPVSP
jgi:Cytochrome P460